MGTRCDFYVDQQWIGSLAWDGYPSRIRQEGVLAATSPDQWREMVASLLAKNNDGTTPEMGWPWPWGDSKTTDYAYVYNTDHDTISVYYFGASLDDGFPNMEGRRKTATAGSARSGVIAAMKGE